MKLIEKLFLRDGDKKLYGEIYVPEKHKDLAVIIAHPFGSTMDTVRSEAKFLARHGFISVIFDFRGAGAFSRSGSSDENSIMTEVEDLEWVIRYVRENICKNIVLIGYSQGGAVAALAAAKDKDLKGIILFYPALSVPELARSMFPSKEAIPEEIFVLGELKGKKYYSDIYDLDMYEAIRNDHPGIILHGIRDELIPITYSSKALSYMPNVEMFFFDKGHAFYIEDDPGVEYEVLSFLNSVA